MINVTVESCKTRLKLSSRSGGEKIMDFISNTELDGMICRLAILELAAATKTLF